VNHFHGAVVIAMVSVRMMQATIDDIINMVAMRDGLMAAVRTMDVMIGVCEVIARRATRGIFGGYIEHMLLNRAVLVFNHIVRPPVFASAVIPLDAINAWTSTFWFFAHPLPFLSAFACFALFNYTQPLRFPAVFLELAQVVLHLGQNVGPHLLGWPRRVIAAQEAEPMVRIPP
jgi:hypothetical protein